MSKKHTLFYIFEMAGIGNIKGQKVAWDERGGDVRDHGRMADNGYNSEFWNERNVLILESSKACIIWWLYLKTNKTKTELHTLKG